jgi:LmbE family N-acetylglucosaminyl deacetylase
VTTEEGPPVSDTTFDRIVVLSTHLDDGVLSIGGWMYRAARGGSAITLVTVLAGDPNDARPGSDWDRRSGFSTVGEAATARRAEDRRACAILGLRTSWLPFGDMLQGRGGSDEAVWNALVPLLANADLVLGPGFPLSHPDHAWLATLLHGEGGSLPTGFYAEQPYRHHAGGALGDPPGAGEGFRWEPVRLSPRERWAKFRAVRAYRSQLALLSDRRGLARRLGFAGGDAGEALAWGP